MFNNNEVLTAFYGFPSVTDRFIQIFESMKKQNQNLRWELVRDFHGSSINRQLVEISVRYLRQQQREVHVSHLNSYLRNRGFDFHMAKDGIEQMLRYGYLYSPREEYVKLVQKYE